MGEAVARFCGRFRKLMAWEPQVRTCRLIIAEAERLPDSAHPYYDAIIAGTHRRLSAYLAERNATDAPDALAQDLLDRIVLPGLFRMLLGAEVPVKEAPDEVSDADLPAIRDIVRTTLAARNG